LNTERNRKRAQQLLKNALLAFKHTVTTATEDRDNDVLESKGAILDPMAPLLLHHMHTLPVGGVLSQLEQTDNKLTAATVLIDLNAETSDIAKLIDAGVLRFSHGFRPLEWEERTKTSSGMPGFRFIKYEIMEVSLVAVPSNPSAEMELVEGMKLASDLFKGYRDDLLAKRPVMVPGCTFVNWKDAATEHEAPQVPTRTFVKAPGGFNPDQEHVEPSTKQYDVLEYKLPGKEIRQRMLRTWAPDLDPVEIPAVIERTNGYSGAHIFELVQFAKTLREESDELTVKSSILSAIDKIDDQRKLLGKGDDVVASTIRMVHSELGKMHDLDGMPDSAKKMCKGCQQRLEKLFEPADEGKSAEITLTEAMTVILSHRNLDELSRFATSIQTSIDVAMADQEALSYRELVAAGNG